MSKRYAIGIDLGGTNVKLNSVSEQGDVLAEARLETRDEPGADWARRVRETVHGLEAERGARAAWIGVATPGLPSADGQMVASLDGRLPGLKGLVWKELLDTTATVRVLNDAQAALVGEAWQGAAKGHRDVLLLTLGTGVGGAILNDGRLMSGQLGRAGHVGHICLDPEAPRGVTTPVPGSLETLIANSTVARRSGGRFTDTAALVAAHRAGDAQASEIWLRSVQRLACGLTSLINTVDPELIIVGGGIAKAGPALFEPLARFMEVVEWRPYGRAVPVVPPMLGDTAGALGVARAAMLAGPAGQYFDKSRDLLASVEAQNDAIGVAADWFAETILAGRMVHVFGSGHSRILVEEMWPRYGSFPGWNPIVELSLTFHNLVVGANGQRQAMFLENSSGLAERILRNFDVTAADAALVISSGGGSVVSIEMAEGFRQKGVKVVALVSAAHAAATPSRHPQGLRLTDCADLVLDTGAPVGDAMVTLPGLDTPVAPGSTLGGCLLINAVKAEVAARLTAAGHPPTVLTASAVVGRERSEALFEAAYDEHARRLARLYQDLGRKEGER